MTEKNYIYKKLSDGRYIKEVDDKVEHLATAEEDAKLATDIRSLLQGPQGEAGTSGTSGVDGTSGRDGAEGRIGRTGLTGPRGLNGTSGTSGSSGQNGTSGVNGEKGEQGLRGFKGEKGDRGDKGFPGLQGPSGRDGSTGVSGTSGTSAPGITSGSSGTSGSGFTWKGAWDINLGYYVNDVVEYNGSSYVCIQNVPSLDSPPPSINWSLMAQNGSSGSSGVNGQNGQSSSYFLYKAKANTYTGNPDHGYILWNNATQTGATAIHINHLSQGSIDIDIFLGLIRQGSNLTIQHQTNSAEYQTWDVSGTPTLVAGANNYWIVPVTLINSTISFGNNDDIFVAVSADSGTSGSSGTSGVNGSTGSSGSSGSSGTSGLVPFTAISTAPGSTTPLVQNINVISSVITIPANTFTAPNSFRLSTYWNNTGTIQNFQNTWYITATYSAPGTTFSNATPIGWTLLATGVSGATRIAATERFVHIYTASGSGDGTKVFAPTVASIIDTGGASSPILTIPINWTQTQYIMLAARNASAGPSLTSRCEYYTLVSYKN
jgi:hypothetical protein